MAPKSQDFPLASATSEVNNPYEPKSGTERRDKRVKKIEGIGFRGKDSRVEISVENAMHTSCMC